MKALVKKSLFRTFLFCAYSILGSLVFHYVERKPICHREMSFKMLEELHRKYNVSLNQSEFTEFANDVFRAVKVGKKVDWTFLNASSYVFTILTTIGYGHMTPETMLGQLLTVLYAIVGLPITMLALKTIGEVIVGLVQSSVLGIERRLFKTTRALNIRLKTFLLTCFLMVCFLLLGALIQIMAEGWSFVEGIYTWFIILSTIGFGDYIPFQSLDQKSDQNQQRGLWFFIIAMAFITLAGLSVVSAVLTSLVQAVEEYRSKIKNTFKRIELLKRKKRTVSRSKMYLYVANHGSLGEIQHYAESDVSLEENRRVRSKTV